jgi:hypothetical protein
LAKPDKSTQSRWSEGYGKLSRSFEANQGQFDSHVKFVSRGAGQTVYLTATQAVFFVHSGKEPLRNQESALSHDSPDQQQTKTASARQAVIRMRLVGANARARVEGLDELPGKSNYFIGNDAKRWHVKVPNYAKVKYEHVYRGVDLICYGNNQRLEYDLIVAAGADPGRIKLAFDGVQQMHIDHGGDLVLVTQRGEMRQHRPIAYQETNGFKVKIAARYVMGRRHQIGFKLGRYDSNKRLVIDPVLSYSSYLGGADQDIANGIAVDASGNAYVTGQTYSLNFPTTPGALQTIPGGNHEYGNGDAFVTKINASGTALLYSTYIGSDGDDSGRSIAVDSSGNAYVTGQGGLAETPGAYGPGEIFVTKLNATGSAIIFTSRLGGQYGYSSVNGIAVDNSGATYVTGLTNSSTFPTTPGAFQTNPGCCGFTVFITKFNPTGSSLVYSTVLGGNSYGRAIAVDSEGSAYVTGEFTGVSFPTTPGAFQTAGSGVAPFVTKLNPTGSALVYSTIVGSSNNGSGRGIALDSAGSAYVTGVVFTPDFPTLNPVQPSIAGSTFFRSSNAGGNWMPSPTGLNSREVLSLAIDPVNSSTLYAGTRGGGVFKSQNGGNSWAAVNTGLTNGTVNTLAISTSAVYAGTEGGAFKKKIGADNWDPINNGLTSSFVNVLAIDPATPTTIYAGTGGYSGGFSIPGGAFKSTDGGDTWNAINNVIFPMGLIVNFISIDPTNSSVLHAAASNGVFRSTDGGANWVKPSTILSNRNVYVLAIDPVNTSTIYAGTSGMYKSTNAGDSWMAITNGLGTVQVRSLAIDPANLATLYAGTFGSGPFKTTDGGSNWTFVGADVTGTVVGALAIDPTASSTVYAGTANRPDAFLLKVDPTGSALVYSTFLGGSRAEMGSGIAVGSDGSAYVVGRSFSVDFPLANPLQPLPGLFPDGFVAKFTPGGNAFDYSTYLGGDDFDSPHGIALDPSGGVYVAGETSSTDFPTTTGAFQPSSGGGFSDSFVAKISSCAFSLSSTSAAFPLTGGSGSVTVNTPAGCNWTAVSNDNWVFITSADSGTGTGTITFELRENFDERFRIGTLTIAGQTFTVLQEGLGSGACSNAISPTFASFPSIGGSGNVNVIANEECIWRAVSNTSWVTLTSNDNGIGVGVVTYSVGANAGAASRNGTITIAGQTFAIKQKGNAAASHGSGGGKP